MFSQVMRDRTNTFFDWLPPELIWYISQYVSQQPPPAQMQWSRYLGVWMDGDRVICQCIWCLGDWGGSSNHICLDCRNKVKRQFGDEWQNLTNTTKTNESGHVL